MNYQREITVNLDDPSLGLSKALIKRARKWGISLNASTVNHYRKVDKNIEDYIGFKVLNAERTEALKSWAEENAEAIAERNRLVEEEGCFAEKYGVMFNSED
jgi:post-segregation antitoxin (ccd killing protein)